MSQPRSQPMFGARAPCCSVRGHGTQGEFCCWISCLGKKFSIICHVGENGIMAVALSWDAFRASAFYGQRYSISREYLRSQRIKTKSSSECPKKILTAMSDHLINHDDMRSRIFTGSLCSALTTSLSPSSPARMVYIGDVRCQPRCNFLVSPHHF